jgi:3-phenylpropionate/trans-cinnamate dioxygenase ferredoxin reductase subunit
MNGRRKVDFVLVGGGTASAHCAAELRRQGADGSILLVGREPEPPYERPPLTKEYLRGEAPRSAAYVHDPRWYDDNDVELLTGTNVLALDADARTVTLSTKEEVEFDKALLATGAMLNLLRVDGAALNGIYYIRAFGNSDAVRDAARDAEHVILVGGGYIGTEVSATLAAQGKRCTIVMLEDVVLSNSFGEEVGRWFHDLLVARGVTILGGKELKAFIGDGHVQGIVTTDGTTIEGDMVVVGAGVRPDVTLASRAGLEVGNGIACDAKLQTVCSGIYAAGDTCSWESELHGGRLRLEHAEVAQSQGRHAARAMLGSAQPYTDVPYFFSDLADWASLEYVGTAHRWNEVVWRGDPDDGNFSAWYLDHGRLAATLAVGQPEDLKHARRLLSSRAAVDRALLADVDSALADL